MAILKEDNLSVEIKFTDFKYGWVYYGFCFLLGSQPVFNKGIQEEDYFFANEYDEDSLIPALEQSLVENRSIEWIPTEPDMWVEIKPQLIRGWEDTKLLIESGSLLYVSDEQKEKLKEIDEKRVKSNGNLPEDYFEITFFVDSYRLKNPDRKIRGYTGDGVAFRITVSREKITKFVEKLKADYQKFIKANEDEIKRTRDERDDICKKFGPK